jgi:hypothetical protein
VPQSPLPSEIEALISGGPIQPPDGVDAVPLIPPAMSPEEYGTTLPELREYPTLFLLRERWIHALLASAEKPMIKNVGVRLALYLNVRSGRCDPSYRRIACDLGNVSRNSVLRAVARLKIVGWIDVQQGGNGRSKTNNFELKMLLGDESQSCETRTENKERDSARGVNGAGLAVKRNP